MVSVCKSCLRPFGPDDVIERDGLALTLGLGISYMGREITLNRSEQIALRLLLSSRFVSHDRLTDEICSPDTFHKRASTKVVISRLRSRLKLLDAPFDIMNRPAMGYSLVRHVSAGGKS